MRKGPSVVVGMSGGVDSAVAAALLAEARCDVVGVTLILWKGDGEEEKRWQDRSCCKVGLARHVAKQLGIPHQTIDVQDTFYRDVIGDFCDTYLMGQTPNPCVRCNERIKFAQLLSAAESLGAAYLATGHYARIREGETGLALYRGKDGAKDQSYFLYRLNQAVLAATLFPLGEMTKEEVYEKAGHLGLPYEEVLESQEICFVNQQDYRTVLTQYRMEAVSPGAIVTEAGERVGSHSGVAFHTVGQRRGLGVALGERTYVSRIDPVKKEVVVGSKSDLFKKTLTADRAVWQNGGPPSAPFSVSAQIRHRAHPATAILTHAAPYQFQLLFDAPVWGVSPGQSVVLYREDAVIGGGIIRPTERDVPEDRL